MNSVKNSKDPFLLMTHLKEMTRARHQQTEQFPFFQALVSGTLPLESYIAYLKALAVIHHAVESKLGASRQPKIQKVWHQDMRKLPLLMADLAFFEDTTITDSPATAKEVLDLTDQIEKRSSEEPLSILGYLYVLEGSSLGALSILPRIKQQFLLSVDGVAYFSGYGKETGKKWQAFKERMNQTELQPNSVDIITACANDLFNGLGRIVNCLYPAKKTSAGPATVFLNPYAGSHPVCHDPRELYAALHAGFTIWEEYPYLSHRFGDRGRAYTKSDSAWLVTLSRINLNAIKKSLKWFSGVLCARGIPSLILERQLQLLFDHLILLVPERKNQYHNLSDAATWLGEMQKNVIPDESARTLAMRFEQLVAGIPDKINLGDIGGLLISAVADEQNHSKESVKSLRAWMTDPSRFSKEWIAAVDTFIQDVRKARIKK